MTLKVPLDSIVTYGKVNVCVCVCVWQGHSGLLLCEGFSSSASCIPNHPSTTYGHSECVREKETRERDRRRETDNERERDRRRETDNERERERQKGCERLVNKNKLK